MAVTLDAALAVWRAGRPADAAAMLRTLLAQRPDLAEGWYNLGYLQTGLGEHDAALAAYAEALRHGISSPEEAHLNRAVLLAQHMARPQRAAEELRQALKLNPRYVPAWINLGNLHEQRGDRTEAAHAYSAALTVAPDHPLALARMVNVTPPGTPDGSLITSLRRCLANPQLSAVDRADLGFALGKALDAAGAFDDAFSAYAAANVWCARQHARPYNRTAHAQWVARLMATCCCVPLSPGDVPGQPIPIFICGLYRSGSTLVETILASHPQVTAGGELDLISTFARELRHRGAVPESLDPQTCGELSRRYMGRLRSLFPGAACVTDKRVDNFLHIGLIKSLFPAARIVITRRERMDNCLSIYFAHLGSAAPYACDLHDIAHWHHHYERLVSHWKSLYGDSIHEVDYDVLVKQPRPCVEALLEHCRLPWTEDCLTPHRANTVISTPSAWQVRRPLYVDSSGRSRHYESHLGALRAAFDQTDTP